MKDTNVWVICGALAVSLILGIAAPVDESGRGGTRPTGDSDLAAADSCGLFTAGDVRYAELALPRESGRPAFGF